VVRTAAFGGGTRDGCEVRLADVWFDFALFCATPEKDITKKAQQIAMLWVRTRRRFIWGSFLEVIAGAPLASSFVQEAAGGKMARKSCRIQI
jgi:hypothetical protein